MIPKGFYRSLWATVGFYDTAPNPRQIGTVFVVTIPTRTTSPGTTGSGSLHQSTSVRPNVPIPSFLLMAGDYFSPVEGAEYSSASIVVRWPAGSIPFSKYRCNVPFGHATDDLTLMGRLVSKRSYLVLRTMRFVLWCEMITIFTFWPYRSLRK